MESSAIIAVVIVGQVLSISGSKAEPSVSERQVVAVLIPPGAVDMVGDLIQ